MTRRPIGVLLAGGMARRMGGGDKCLRPLGGKPLLAHVIERMRPQCEGLLLSANGPPDRFARFGLPLVADTVTGRPGPLAGMLAGMLWVAVHRPELADIVTVPTDCPFLPNDLVPRLMEARRSAGATAACAASAGRLHPVIGVWPVALATSLAAALEQEKLRAARDWLARHSCAVAPYPAEPRDPFFNVNTEADLLTAEALLVGRAVTDGPRPLRGRARPPL